MGKQTYACDVHVKQDGSAGVLYCVVSTSFLHFILITLLSMTTDLVAYSLNFLSSLVHEQACARQALLCECGLHTLLA